MKNVLTTGSEIFPKSLYPLREDKALLIKTIEDPDVEVSEYLVCGKKVWDEGNTKVGEHEILFAWNYYGNLIKKDQYVRFYRVGDYNTETFTLPLGFELKTKSEDRVSWICFQKNPTIFVKDLGDGTGKEVVLSDGVFIDASWASPKKLVASDMYWDNFPPFQEGRVYFAQEMKDSFLIFLTGKGVEIQKFEKIVEGTYYNYTLQIGTDSSGKVTSFTGDSGPLVIPRNLRWETAGYRPDSSSSDPLYEYANARTYESEPGKYITVSSLYARRLPTADYDPTQSEDTPFRIAFYENYDTATKIYSNKVYERDAWGYDTGGSSDPIEFERPGTLAVDKLAMTGGQNPYGAPNYYYVEYAQLGGTKRKTVNNTNTPTWRVEHYPHWRLRLKDEYFKFYDPIAKTWIHNANTPGPEHTHALFFGVEAYKGINDEATDYLLYLPPGSGSGGPVPGYPGITASHYILNSGLFFCDHSADGYSGGGLAISRAGSDWFFWDAGAGAFYHPGNWEYAFDCLGNLWRLRESWSGWWRSNYLDVTFTFEKRIDIT